MKQTTFSFAHFTSKIFRAVHISFLDHRSFWTAFKVLSVYIQLDKMSCSPQTFCWHYVICGNDYAKSDGLFRNTRSPSLKQKNVNRKFAHISGAWQINSTKYQVHVLHDTCYLFYEGKRLWSLLLKSFHMMCCSIF